MLRLTPRGIVNGIANAIIPDEIKRQVMDSFVSFSDSITVDQFNDMVEADVSVWQKICVPAGLSEPMREAVKGNEIFVSIINEQLILDWLLECRSDLAPIVNTEAGRLWFYRQFAEMKRELGAE